MTLKKDGLSVLLIIFVAIRIIRYFADGFLLKLVTAALLLTVIVFSLPKVAKLTKLVLGSLFLAGAALLVSSGATPSVWLTAIVQNSGVVMLLICVPFISAPFYYEDYQSELKTLVQARMRNVLSFLLLATFSSHLLAGILSIGAMMIIYSLMKPFAMLYDAHEPFVKTTLRAYASSGFWSPAWASVIVYTALPDVQWVKVIPVGLAFAVVLNIINLLSVYIEKKKSPGLYHDISPDEGAVINRKMLLVMLFLAIAMIGSIAIINAVTGWDLMLIVTLVSLLFPLAAAIIQRHFKELKREFKGFYDKSLVKVREQVAIFTLAGFLAKSIDVAGVGDLIIRVLPDWLRTNSVLMVCAIMIIMILPAFVGVHPAASGTAIVTALSPAALGLTSYTFALTILTGWLLTILMSPFSAVALLLAAATGKSNFALSIGMNWRFCLVCLAVFSALITIVGPLMG